MDKQTLLKFVLACAMSVPGYVSADEAGDLDLLTCNIGRGIDFPSADWDHLHYASTPEGGFFIPGPVREQGLCIQNATISAAFGVYMVMAELCNATPQPLMDWLVKSRPSLQRSSTVTEPRMIAEFRDQKGSVFIFYGRASFMKAPDNLTRDPKERQLSFGCSYRGSGPQ